MPKEQGHFGERAARSTSKTAKDKSNSATLQAFQGGTRREPSGMGDMSNHMLRCDSEKDSGYSGEQRSLWMFGCRLHEYPTDFIYLRSVHTKNINVFLPFMMSVLMNIHSGSTNIGFKKLT